MAKTATFATTGFVAQGILNGLLDDDDECDLERTRREHQEEQWKQYWRDNPDRNPAMAKAFANN